MVILSNNRCSAVIHMQLIRLPIFFFLALIVSQAQRKPEECMALSSVSEVTDIVTTTVNEIYSRWKFPTRERRKFKLS